MARSGVPLSVIAGALGVLVVATGCKKPPPPIPPPTVLVAPAVEQDLSLTAEFVGTIDGYVNAEIRARVKGFLKTQDYQDGAFVKKGQLLFTIDPSEYLAAVAKAKGALARAQAAYSQAKVTADRYRPLAAKQAVSQQELDDAVASQRVAMASVDSAKATLDESQLNLGYCRISSPVDGVAGTLLVRVGNLVGQSEPDAAHHGLAARSDAGDVPDQRGAVHADCLAGGGAGEAGPAGRGHRAPGPRPASRRRIGLPPQGLVHLRSTARWRRAPAPSRCRRSSPTRSASSAPASTVGSRRRARDEGKPSVVVPENAVKELQGTYTVAVVTPEDTVQIRAVEVGPRAEQALGDHQGRQRRGAGDHRGRAEGLGGPEGRRPAGPRGGEEHGERSGSGCGGLSRDLRLLHSPSHRRHRHLDHHGDRWRGGGAAAADRPVPGDRPAADPADHHVHRRRRADRRAVGGHAHRAADERRGQHALSAVHQRERRDAHPDRHLRPGDQRRHRQRPGPEPLQPGPGGRSPRR